MSPTKKMERSFLKLKGIAYNLADRKYPSATSIMFANKSDAAAAYTVHSFINIKLNTAIQLTASKMRKMRRYVFLE